LVIAPAFATSRFPSGADVAREGKVSHRQGYLPTLDGWRALSVIGVILYHGRSRFFTSGSLLSKLSSRGNIGVDVFFAISGFLICGLLLQEHERYGGISLRRFYIRRCCRILPPYYLALAGICAVAALGVIHLNYSNLPSCLLFYRDYRPLGTDEQGGFYTAHFWSLAVEEHFYLIWPVLLIAVKPKRAGKLALLLALAVFGWRVLDGHFEFFAGLLPKANLMARTDTRIDALLWGCLAAIYFPKIQRAVEHLRFSQLWLPIWLVQVVAVAIRAPVLTLLQAVLLPALVLSTVTQPASILGRILEWQPLRWIGTLSYSLYLWQMLFLPEIPSEMAHGAFQSLQRPPWNVLAILVSACLSRYLVELPMTRLGHRLGARFSLAEPHRWFETIPQPWLAAQEAPSGGPLRRDALIALEKAALECSALTSNMERPEPEAPALPSTSSSTREPTYDMGAKRFSPRKSAYSPSNTIQEDSLPGFEGPRRSPWPDDMNKGA
jgi:peptidoglycan/LPS O-acetylase OafA/YrhL